jgi:hypothetical protein
MEKESRSEAGVLATGEIARFIMLQHPFFSISSETETLLRLLCSDGAKVEKRPVLQYTAEPELE